MGTRLVKRKTELKAKTSLKATTPLKKTTLIKKKSTASVAKLKAKLDKQFSLYVRLRDSNSKGIGKCITCDEPKHYTQAHAGHFQSRRYLNTRWDEQNVNLQCPGCNNWGAGEQYKYAKALDLKYGKEVPEFLHDLAHDPDPAFPQKNKAYREWLQDQLEYYTTQVHEQLQRLGE